MSTNRHNWCPEPTGGTRQSAILPELLWCRPRVSVLHGPSPGFWPDGSFVDPPTLSYSAMVSSTETTASTSVAGVTPLSHLPPRVPAIEAMDMLPPLTTENLLATAGIGRAANHRPRCEYQLLQVSDRRDLGCLNSRCLLLEGRKRCRQHLINNRCSHLNALPPN